MMWMEFEFETSLLAKTPETRVSTSCIFLAPSSPRLLNRGMDNKPFLLFFYNRGCGAQPPCLGGEREKATAMTGSTPEYIA